VWDFSWSLVGYSALILLGIGSSVNRYVAMHLAEKNVKGLNQSISSVLCVQFVMGLIILALTATIVWAVPFFWSGRLRELIADTQWLVLLLGVSMSLDFAFGAFDGVLTGCHRWNIYNSINAGSHAITVMEMLVALIFGGSIV